MDISKLVNPQSIPSASDSQGTYEVTYHNPITTADTQPYAVCHTIRYCKELNSITQNCCILSRRVAHYTQLRPNNQESTMGYKAISHPLAFPALIRANPLSLTGTSNAYLPSALNLETHQYNINITKTLQEKKHKEWIFHEEIPLKRNIIIYSEIKKKKIYIKPEEKKFFGKFFNKSTIDFSS